jgi:hypothetical protein
LASPTDQGIIGDFFTWLRDLPSYKSAIEQNDEDGFAARSKLLLLEVSITDESWEEVVFGHLLYESLSWGDKVVSRLVSYVEKNLPVMLNLGSPSDSSNFTPPSLESLHGSPCVFNAG